MVFFRVSTRRVGAFVSFTLLLAHLFGFVVVAFLQQVVEVFFLSPPEARGVERENKQTGDRSAAFFMFTHGFNTEGGGMDICCTAHATPRIAQASR